GGALVARVGEGGQDGGGTCASARDGGDNAIHAEKRRRIEIGRHGERFCCTWRWAGENALDRLEHPAELTSNKGQGREEENFLSRGDALGGHGSTGVTDRRKERFR